jgi:hypothetical protein
MGAPIFEEVLEKLKIDNIKPEDWSVLWEESQSRFSPDADFLQKEYILEQNNYLHLIDEVVDMILQVVEKMRSDEYLARFAFHMNYIIFETEKKSVYTLEPWPNLRNYLGDLCGGFDAIVYISGIRLIKKKFEDRGIGREILEHTLFDLMEKFYRYHDAYGIWYVDCQGWMCRIFKGVFINIGRLQYEFRTNHGLKVYRHKTIGKTVAFFTSPQKIRTDGLMDGTNGITDENAFETIFEEDEKIVKGNPIIPTGYVSEKVITLPKSEWELALDEGDQMLNIHIPRRGRMPFEEIEYSLKSAIPFYNKHFPEVPIKAFFCSSWLLGNCLEKLLDENSNIIRFQREFYLAPQRSNEGSAIFFVFGRSDYRQLVPKTTLEKKIFESKEKGYHLYNGIGFILFEDMPRLGEQQYRKRFIEI